MKITDVISGPTSRLDFVKRYSSIPSISVELTSTHTFWVSFYSAVIHRLYGSETISGVSVPEGKLYLKAIVHDLAEAVTGDIVRPFKYCTPELKKEVDRAEDEMIEKHFPDVVKSMFREVKSGNVDIDTYINEVVKAADFCSLYMYMRREHMTGNRMVKPFYDLMVSELKAQSEKKTISERVQQVYVDLYNEAK